MKIEMYSYWIARSWNPEPYPVLMDHNTTNEDYYFAGMVTVDMQPPPGRAEIVAGQVVGLRKRQAEHQNAITELERKIMELQCIECKS